MSSKALDHLRTFLDHLDGEDRDHQLEFFRSVLSAGPEAVLELDSRLPGSRAPRALRQLAMEACFYFPWSEWVPILSRILRYESVHAVFETGARALGRIGSDEALASLRELYALRPGPEFKETLAGVLAQTDPQEAFNHYLGRLLEGTANPGVANEAAQRLLPLVDDRHLEALRTLAMHPDLLVFRHAIQLMANIHSPEAAEALADLFENSHHEVLADRRLKEVLVPYRAFTALQAREKALEALRAVNAGEAPELPPGVKEFYREVLAATEEGRSAQFQPVLAQTAEAMHQRARRLGFAVDATAEGLATLVLEGHREAQSVLDLLVQGFREQTGREGVSRALARLAPANSEAVFTLLLEGPDAAQRAAAVEVLGAREEPEMQAVLLRACFDPLTDIADRALVHLGHLPGAQALAQDLMRSPKPEEMALGLRLVSQGRYQACVPQLLEMVRGTSREETAALVIETLGQVGGALAAAQLLDMLHSGQNLRIQTLVAQALQNLGDPDVALSLCAKADQIKVPVLHGIAVEALAKAHPDADRPLPGGNAPLLLHQVRKGWTDKNPWSLRLRIVQALRGLWMDHPETWSCVSDLVRDSLAEKRPLGVWSPDALQTMQAAAKEFARRAGTA